MYSQPFSLLHVMASRIFPPQVDILPILWIGCVMGDAEFARSSKKRGPRVPAVLLTFAQSSFQTCKFLSVANFNEFAVFLNSLVFIFACVWK